MEVNILNRDEGFGEKAPSIERARRLEIGNNQKEDRNQEVERR